MRLISLSLFCLTLFVSKAQDPVVTTDKGKVAGYTKDGLQIFKGIPFAAPPVRDLRWRAPQPMPAWAGILQTKNYSASPMQRKPAPFSCWTEEFIAPPEPLSEDCLYLNVWTSETTTKKPVVLWIYGGGFNSGSTACAIYDGSQYAKNDVVFVSANYRVNIFGFFAHADLKNTDGNANFGLLDQVQALRWIHDNIAAFGGDPENVTIMGQSAGSFSVHALVASPLTKGLFNKAIGHSGGILGTNRGVSLATAAEAGVKFQSQVGANALADLKAMSAENLLEQALKHNPPYSPVLDNYLLPTDLKAHYEAGLHNDVSVMAGWVTGDGALFGNAKVSLKKYQDDALQNFGEKSESFLKLFPAHDDGSATAMTSFIRRLSFAGIPAILWAEYNKKSAYLYEFDHVPTDKPDFPNYGAFHTSEVPFALHNLYTWNRPWRPEDKRVEEIMSGYWLNFIKKGNPNGSGLPTWKPYDSRYKNVQIIKQSSQSQANLYKDQIEFLKQR